MDAFSGVLFTICLLGTLSNLTTIFLIVYKLDNWFENKNSQQGSPHRRVIVVKQTSSHQILLNQLFISDFILCVTNLILFGISLTNGIEDSSLICKIQGSISASLAACTVLIMCGIAYDRFVTIVNKSNVNAKIIGVFCWSMCLILALLIVVLPGMHIVVTPSKAFCIGAWQVFNITTQIYSFTCIFILVFTLCLTAVYYYRIYRYTAKIEVQTHATFKRVKNLDIAKKMFILVICFIICWSPYCMMMMYNLITNKTVNPIIDGLATCCSFFNSFLNPIIYLLLNKDKFKKQSNWVINLPSPLSRT